MHDDFAVEPVPGLPEPLPAGEDLLWQGAPEWRRAAWTVFPSRLVSIYFLVIAAWRCLDAVNGSVPVGDVFISILWLGVPAGATFAIFLVLGWLVSRTTVYTITSRRVVIRAGIALPITTNVPFDVVQGAALRSFRDGSGDVVLSLLPTARVGYLVLWPHVRPWRFTPPRPMFRAVADAARVADLLGAALRGYAKTGLQGSADSADGSAQQGVAAGAS